MATRWALTILVAWPVVGVLTAVVLRRRGHDFFSWAVLGAFFGPLTVPLGFHVARLETRVHSRVVAEGVPGAGDLAVLVGVDGSAESAAALRVALAAFGDRIGRLTLARVVDFEAAADDAGEASVELREEAELDLLGRAASLSPLEPETLLLGGEPAQALCRAAEDGAYDVLVVGRRGKGLAKTLLGSTAAHLARVAPIPVFMSGSVESGQDQEHDTRHASTPA